MPLPVCEHHCLKFRLYEYKYWPTMKLYIFSVGHLNSIVKQCFDWINECFCRICIKNQYIFWFPQNIYCDLCTVCNNSVTSVNTVSWVSHCQLKCQEIRSHSCLQEWRSVFIFFQMYSLLFWIPHWPWHLCIADINLLFVAKLITLQVLCLS